MLAVRAARAFDGEQMLTDGALVLVDGSRIIGVESIGTPVPEEARIIEVPDSTLLPGLINMHVHLCGDSHDDALERVPDFSPADLQAVIDTALTEQLVSGVTTVRDLGDHQWAVTDRHDRSLPDSGRPRILASGPPITSPHGHCWSMGGEASGDDALRAAVRERAERGVDVVKVMASGGNMTAETDVTATQFDLAELRSIVEEAHRHGLPVTSHAHALAAVEQSIEAGVDGIEHCSCITTDGFEPSSDLFERMRDRGIIVCPTLGKALDAVVPPRVQEMLARTGMTYAGRQAMFTLAHEIGVRLVSGDDAGISRGKRHGVFAEAIIDLHEGGVPLADALATATSGAAGSCGLAHSKGRLRAGCDADLLLVHGNLATDVTALRSVAAVVAGGQVVFENTTAPQG